jgi:hypothetical protein
VAPPGNQAANRENKLQPVAMEVPSLLDRFGRSIKIEDITGFRLLKTFPEGTAISQRNPPILLHFSSPESSIVKRFLTADFS